MLLLPLHNPVELAEVGAFMDVLTGGKFLLGVGLGYRPEEFAVFGVPMAERVSPRPRPSTSSAGCGPRTTSPTTAATGSSPMRDKAAPAAVAGPPILIGAQVDAAIARAANTRRRLAGGADADDRRAAHADDDLHRDARRRQAAAEPSYLPALEVACAPDDGTAFRRVAPYLLEKYKAYVSWGLEGCRSTAGRAGGAVPPPRGRSLRGWLAGAGIDELVAQYRAGTNHLSMRVSWPGMAQAAIFAGIELLGPRVLPEVRKRASAA